MDYTWITAAAVAIGLFVLVVAVAWQGGEGPSPTHHPVLERYQRYVDGPTATPSAPPEQASLLERVRGLLGADREEGALPLGRRRGDLADALERADIKMRPDEWILVHFAIGFVLFVVFAWRVHIVVGAIVAVVLPYFGGRLYLSLRSQRRVNAFARQLPDVLLQLSNSLRAGHSFIQAMSGVAENARPPLSTEFARAVREMHLGVPTEDALRRLVERNGSDDLDLAITAVNLTRVVGGNLAEMLDSIAETIRERVRIRGEIRTVTAQARFSGWIITLLPLGLAALLTVIAPDYFTPMFRDGFGWALMIGGLVSMIIGLYFIRRIVDIELW